MEPAETTTEIARIVVPEIIDIDVIRNEIGPSIDKMLNRSDSTVAKFSVGIKDDESMAMAVKEAEFLRDDGQDLLEKWRETFYMEVWYRPGEKVREIFDTRLKRVIANKKTILGYISDYKNLKERQAKIAREKAEAEARRAREDAERKQREAVEAEARAKQAAEDEKRRKEEAEAAEKRRIAAEAEAKERREREAREAAAAETRRKLDEEERSRITHAEVAHAEGNGAAKVDTILESATPISPVLGKAEQAGSLESVRLEQENAKKIADEKAAREKLEADEAERRRKDAEAEAFRKREEADNALAAATASAAAAAATANTEKQDTGTTSAIMWRWDLESDGTEMGDIAAVMAVLKAILDGIYPIEFIGYNRKRPQDFRPSAIGDDVTDKKERFVQGHGIRAYPQQDERLKRRVVGGRR